MPRPRGVRRRQRTKREAKSGCRCGAVEPLWLKSNRSFGKAGQMSRADPREMELRLRVRSPALELIGESAHSRVINFRHDWATTTWPPRSENSTSLLAGM